MNSPQDRPLSSGSETNRSTQPAEAQNASKAEIARFVSTIKDAEQQVGEHIIRALQHEDTVAVLTTVVIGPGGQQHIVSAALNPQRTAEINQLLQSASEERVDEVMCVGFHCLIKPKPASE
ncbi:MAG: hypothetical protein R3C53_15770 [Pirellulaceae bacterium]